MASSKPPVAPAPTRKTARPTTASSAPKTTAQTKPVVFKDFAAI